MKPCGAGYGAIASGKITEGEENHSTRMATGFLSIVAQLDASHNNECPRGSSPSAPENSISDASHLVHQAMPPGVVERRAEPSSENAMIMRASAPDVSEIPQRSPAEARSDSESDVDTNTDTEINVEGFIYNDQIYLKDVSGRSNKIFASTRDEGGNLIQVGTWDAEKQQLLALKYDASSAGTAAHIYPFEVDSNDHCETLAYGICACTPCSEDLSEASQQACRRIANLGPVLLHRYGGKAYA